jgi:hypothetical protein
MKKQRIYTSKKRYRFKKTTVYERGVIMKQKEVFSSPAEAPFFLQQVVEQPMSESCHSRQSAVFLHS